MLEIGRFSRDSTVFFHRAPTQTKRCHRLGRCSLSNAFDLSLSSPSLMHTLSLTAIPLSRSPLFLPVLRKPYVFMLSFAPPSLSLSLTHSQTLSPSHSLRLSVDWQPKREHGRERGDSPCSRCRTGRNSCGGGVGNSVRSRFGQRCTRGIRGEENQGRREFSGRWSHDCDRKNGRKGNRKMDR